MRVFARLFAEADREGPVREEETSDAGELPMAWTTDSGPRTDPDSEVRQPDDEILRRK